MLFYSVVSYSARILYLGLCVSNDIFFRTEYSVHVRGRWEGGALEGGGFDFRSDFVISAPNMEICPQYGNISTSKKYVAIDVNFSLYV